jgi:hypothetical protein
LVLFTFGTARQAARDSQILAWDLHGFQPTVPNSRTRALGRAISSGFIALLFLQREPEAP